MESALALNDDTVATMHRPQLQQRLALLIEESHRILDAGIADHVTADGKRIAGIVGLFSGGNDSTVLCHLMRSRMTYLAHANTTIGIEQTRQFVRETAATWGIPLLEFTPPREADHYRSLVLERGFPGPAQHWKMYQRLKERGLRQVRKTLVTSRDQRVIYLAGRRRTESARRANVPAYERQGSVVFVSPMVNWTKLDLNTYRLAYDVPVNEVTDLIHMSGECMCGAFAHAGELDEIGAWFPLVVQEIRDLEAEIADRVDIPEERRRWGWGAYRDQKASKVGALCSSCDARWQQEALAPPDAWLSPIR